MMPGAEPNSPAAATPAALAGAAAVLLGLGVLVYVVARPPGVLFLPDAWQLGWRPPSPFLAAMLGSLPSFAHALGFGFLTAAVCGRARAAPAMTIGWSGVNLAFELSQLPFVHDGPLGLVVSRLQVSAGTFDPADCLGLLLAPCAAFAHRWAMARAATPREKGAVVLRRAAGST